MNNKKTQHTEQASLQDIMNRMATRVEGLRPQDGAARGVLSEAEAYAAFDPLLGQLLKHYRDAHAQYETLLRRNGAADAMVAVAADMAASCDSAVETRLIELRAHNTTRRMAEARMRESIEQLNASTRYREKLERHAHFQSADMARRRAEAKEGMAWVMYLWWMLHFSLIEAQRRLSVAHDFTRASMRDDRLVAA